MKTFKEFDEKVLSDPNFTEEEKKKYREAIAEDNTQDTRNNFVAGIIVDTLQGRRD